MCTRVQSYANTGIVNISTANTNRNGTGALGTVLTAMDAGSGGVGTTVNSITIKATGSTSAGIVRLYTSDGTNNRLYMEIKIPAVSQSSSMWAYQAVVGTKLSLNPGHMLKASTQNADSFNIIAFGADFKNCDCSNDANTCNANMLYTANTGIVNINSANPYLDGAGTLGTVLSANGNAGTQVSEVIVNATGATTQGMVRLFLNDGTDTNYLIREVPIPALTPTGSKRAFRVLVYLGAYIQSGYTLLASTNNGESFNVITTASDWENCPCNE